MGKSYSSDLRERIIGYVEEGHSRREAARRFGVSPSFAVKLLARWEKTHACKPARQGRPRGGGKLAPYRLLLIQRVEQCPGITMPELAAALHAERGVRASPASLSRFLCRAGFTCRKAGGARIRARRLRTGEEQHDAAPPISDAA